LIVADPAFDGVTVTRVYFASDGGVYCADNVGATSFRHRPPAASSAPPSRRRASHFYTPFADECTALKANPAWQFESIAFYVQLPDGSGNCPAGTVPLYRLYNNSMGGAPNHRYTTSLAILNQMLAAGWTFEGNAATKVFACVPQ
jgi:Repeat of unknown function (DUF5648)